MAKWMIFLLSNLLIWQASFGQAAVDSAYIGDFELPYVVRTSLERTGAGMEISPDNTLVPPTASFPFNTGTNLGIHVSYKFINFSISPSLHSRTNNSSLVVALNTYNGGNNFGGKLGFYNNVAALEDKKNIRVRSTVSLLKFSPYWLINTNFKRLSLAAVTDYSQRQKKSAGSFMFEFNPSYLHAQGKNGLIIPEDSRYQQLFGNLAGLSRLTIINLDIRPGYVYTKCFNEGEYFISGGLFLGPGFGYHHANAATSSQGGMHWQSSLRMSGSLGYNGDNYFIVGAFRYTNSFTPVSSAGVLADEGTFMLTFGLRFDAFENRLPKTWQALMYAK